MCLDIDETLSTRGKLTAEAYAALWRLKAAGLRVVPLTGRPAGWCDQIARFWPVDAVVGENGAFTFYMDGVKRARLHTPAEPGPAEAKKKLEKLRATISRRFPSARWASDQAYREFDLAIDIREDVPAWSARQVEALLKLCRREGAHAKLSSIHVNVWYGAYDKLTGFKHWLQRGAPRGTPQDLTRWLFIGDSPNDEPLFAGFHNTVGVGNLRQYLKRLRHPPRWVTRAESGAGFVEMADRVIRAVQGPS